MATHQTTPQQQSKLPFPVTLRAYDADGASYSVQDVYGKFPEIPAGYEVIGFGSTESYTPYLLPGSERASHAYNSCFSVPRLLLRKVETPAPVVVKAPEPTPASEPASYPNPHPLRLDAPLMTRSGLRVRNVGPRATSSLQFYGCDDQTIIGEYEANLGFWITTVWYPTGQSTPVAGSDTHLFDLVYRPLDLSRVRRTRGGNVVTNLGVVPCGDSNEPGQMRGQTLRGDVRTSGYEDQLDCYWYPWGQFYCHPWETFRNLDLVEDAPEPEPTEPPKVTTRKFKPRGVWIYYVSSDDKHKLRTTLQGLVVTKLTGKSSASVRVTLADSDRCDFAVACQYAFLKAIRSEPFPRQHELFAKFLDEYYEPAEAASPEPEPSRPVVPPAPVASDPTGTITLATQGAAGLSVRDLYYNCYAAIPWNRVFAFRVPVEGDIVLGVDGDEHIARYEGFSSSRLILRPGPDTIDPASGKTVREVYGESRIDRLPFDRAIRFGYPKKGEVFCSMLSVDDVIAGEVDEELHKNNKAPRLILSPPHIKSR